MAQRAEQAGVDFLQGSELSACALHPQGPHSTMPTPWVAMYLAYSELSAPLQVCSLI